MQIDTSSVADYIERNARPLDMALYNFRFRSGDKVTVLQALTPYQNSAGGFGNAIEPDLDMPQSSPLGTTVACQYLAEVDATADDAAVRHSIDYFLATYNHALTGWNIICKEANDYPHAPWWDYQQSLASFEWGNPSAEILGYLLYYPAIVPDALLAAITDKALQRLHVLTKPDFHELLCYQRLYTLAGQTLQARLFEPLANLIRQATNLDPQAWNTYGATPLTFVKSPQSPFADLFDTAVLQTNLDHLEAKIVDGNHWEPTWDWGGNYPDTWQKAKQAWSGKLTVDNMAVLKAFERLESQA
jgi:hypothetical protein